MKWMIAATVLISGLALGAEQGGAANLRIGFVDLRKALESVDAYKGVKTSLDKDLAAKKSELEKQQQSLQKDAEQFDKKSAILNDSAKAQKQQELQKRFAELQKNAQESQVELQKRERDLTQPLVDELRAVIEGVGKEKEYQLVLNEGAVLYAAGGADITSDVISRFNSRHKSRGSEKKKK